ncbi:unnamed protein product [Rotaria sp. Silwood1]|nr:unnamed protein product [Rotaria sp. Silwood1]
MPYKIISNISLAASETSSLCSTPCADRQICFSDTCVYTGNLAITIIWSRPGNCDLDVQTPNRWEVFPMYPTEPTEYTDYGQMDVTSELTGPENAFWDVDHQTPQGLYHICLEVFFFDGVVDENNPLIANVFVRKPSRNTETFTRTFMNRTDGIYICNINSVGYIASIAYP